MAKSQDLTRGTSPASTKSPKCNKQGNNDNHDDGNEPTPKKQKRTMPKAKKMTLRAKQTLKL